MTSARKRVGLAALSLASLLVGLTWAAQPAERGGGIFSAAHAVIGRPVTPVSYAGVARRTTVRTVSYGATAAGAAAAGAAVVGASAAAAASRPPTTVVVAAPGAAPCVKVVDGYGVVSYRCQ
jgi:hypothetical protein